MSIYCTFNFAYIRTLSIETVFLFSATGFPHEQSAASAFFLSVLTITFLVALQALPGVGESPHLFLCFPFPKPNFPFLHSRIPSLSQRQSAVAFWSTVRKGFLLVKHLIFRIYLYEHDTLHDSAVHHFLQAFHYRPPLQYDHHLSIKKRDSPKYFSE